MAGRYATPLSMFPIDLTDWYRASEKLSKLAANRSGTRFNFLFCYLFYLFVSLFALFFFLFLCPMRVCVCVCVQLRTALCVFFSPDLYVRSLRVYVWMLPIMHIYSPYAPHFFVYFYRLLWSRLERLDTFLHE